MNRPSERANYQGSIQPKNFYPLPADWTSDWETFPSSDGKLQLYAVTHHAQEWKGHRVLVVLHGMGEHGGRYLHFPHYLHSVVDAVYCMDHRGHGRSEGLRGHIESFDLFADDVSLAISRLEENLKKRFGKAEIFLMGHSMGGLIALRTLLKYPKLPLQCATVSAPLLAIGAKVPPLKKLGGIVLSKVWGSVHMTSEIDPKTLSHDPEVVEAYRVDRLVHSKITPRFFTELSKTMAETLKIESGIQHPLQVLVPLQDRLVQPNPTLEFFRALKIRDKQLKTYSGFFHESFNEIGKEEVFEDLASWIKVHS